MRFVYALLSVSMTVFLCILLGTRWVFPLPFAEFLSPQQGIWQNAESLQSNKDESLSILGLKAAVNVYLDDREVPHVFAENELDAYRVQGYLHAKYRLFQMELITRSASGRLSEWFGRKALDHDRSFRRLGMVFAAERTLAEMESDVTTKAVCDAYTAGVNAYLTQLTRSALPVEFKLIGRNPEKWTNLKSALFLKYMSYDLAGFEQDVEMTNARSFFTRTTFDYLYPAFSQLTRSIIPSDTGYRESSRIPVAPLDADSTYFAFRSDSASFAETEKPRPENGSNNWAVDSSLTASGFPILCNDPHLGLHLPSLWFEIQLNAPGLQVYGVSFPGTPGIIIGFNEQVAFGFTNAGRDVRDYYEIDFKDSKKESYRFNGDWLPSEKRIEIYQLNDGTIFKDTVHYTHIGPVMYDDHFGGERMKSPKSYAVRWKAHDPSNEFMLFYLLNRAKNYDEYVAASKYLKTPGQNIVFASVQGDIALRAQGEFPAKWKGQGDFLMPGWDSTYLWQRMIPDEETPYQHNPARGYVSSANQHPVDSVYPYYLGNHYPILRGMYLNQKLDSMRRITISDMMKLQTDVYNPMAGLALPLLDSLIPRDALKQDEQKQLDWLLSWDARQTFDSKQAILFDLCWNSIYDTIFNDDFLNAPKPIAKPSPAYLLERLMRDTAFPFADQLNTTTIESVYDAFISGFRKGLSDYEKWNATNRGKAWSDYQTTYVGHLLKLAPFSLNNLKSGGGRNCLNAVQSDHGPSWRMVVSLTPDMDAYGIYPGGQSGNPGSPHYDDGIETWVQGRYYQLWMMKLEQTKDKRIQRSMKFTSTKS
jgi:penicillin amidase